MFVVEGRVNLTKEHFAGILENRNTLGAFMQIHVEVPRRKGEIE